MRIRLMLLVMLLSLFAVSALGQNKPAKEEVYIPIHVQSEWKPLTNVKPSGVGYTADTYSAIKIDRAIDPKTNNPYDASPNPFECDLSDLRRSFRLDKDNFLLGEPIVVEFRVELVGPGEWDEPTGGNYRARGRDDNFLFLMKRRGDDSWVPDPYGISKGLMGGGLGGGQRARQGNPVSVYNGLQRWVALDQPGSYDLYCIQFEGRYDVVGEQQAMVDGLPESFRDKLKISDTGSLLDIATGRGSDKYTLSLQVVNDNKPESPVYEQIPEEVRALWQQQFPWRPSIQDYAHFTVTIANGNADQRRKMVDEWTVAAEAPNQNLTSEERIARAKAGYGMDTEGRRRAVREAIWFVRQDDFLTFIEKQISSGGNTDNVLAGLSMNPSPKALDLLMKAKPTQIGTMFRWLPPARIPLVSPALIERLSSDDQPLRADAYIALQSWTGQSFGHDWDKNTTAHDRPTLEEGKKMQPLWRDWWEKNKATFVPKQTIR